MQGSMSDVNKDDGIMLARAGINGVGPFGYEALAEFFKQNPGAVMPTMPFPMFIDFLKRGIEFSVDSEAHGDRAEDQTDNCS